MDPTLQLRKRQFIFMGAILAVGVLAGGLTVAQPWQRPSTAIKQLRQIEKQLALPEPASRQEMDRGAYKDDQGVPRHERRIINAYAGGAVPEAVSNGLPGKGWQQVNIAEFQGVTMRYYVNAENRTCVTVRTITNAKGGTPHNVTIYSSQDDACSKHF